MQNYISPEGLEKVKKELEQLKTVDRVEIIDRISRARDLGDLSENAEYHEARERQSFVEGRIQELESLIKSALIINNEKNTTGSVGVGSTVHATYDNGVKVKYMIVGHTEADPMNGKISHESPLGKAFIGKIKGDEFELAIPAGKIKCKIDHIE
ncbi:MAG: transcription elongation factor GreA [bacterium]